MLSYAYDKNIFCLSKTYVASMIFTFNLAVVPIANLACLFCKDTKDLANQKALMRIKTRIKLQKEPTQFCNQKPSLKDLKTQE